MTTQEVMAFAFKDTAIKACYDTKQKWQGYDVYEPTYGEDGAMVGLPNYILVKGDKIRWSRYEESIEICNFLYPEEE